MCCIYVHAIVIGNDRQLSKCVTAFVEWLVGWLVGLVDRWVEYRLPSRVCVLQLRTYPLPVAIAHQHGPLSACPNMHGAWISTKHSNIHVGSRQQLVRPAGVMLLSPTERNSLSLASLCVCTRSTVCILVEEE